MNELISRSQYEKLVARSRRILSGGCELHRTWVRVSIHAKFMLPNQLEDRREHGEDLALQALSDACGQLGLSEQFDSDW